MMPSKVDTAPYDSKISIQQYAGLDNFVKLRIAIKIPEHDSLGWVSVDFTEFDIEKKLGEHPMSYSIEWTLNAFIMKHKLKDVFDRTLLAALQTGETKFGINWYCKFNYEQEISK